MKIFVLFFFLICLAVTSCAQQPNQPQPTLPKEQTQSVVAHKTKIPVDGMVCSACQSTVKKTIKSLPGVKNVEVSLENKTALITYNADVINPEQIQKAINDKGYTAGKPQEVKQ